MGIQIDKNRTDSYIGTFDYASADDMLQLQEVRNMVKNMNKSLRAAKMDYQFRVVVRGRGQNRFKKTKAWFEKKYDRKFSDGYIRSRCAQDLPLECADRVDAYILLRRY